MRIWTIFLEMTMQRKRRIGTSRNMDIYQRLSRVYLERSPTPSVERESSEALSASELRHRRELEYEEDENQEEENVVELKHAMLSIPNSPMPKSSDGNVMFPVHNSFA